jgi:hypothetical protein
MTFPAAPASALSSLCAQGFSGYPKGAALFFTTDTKDLTMNTITINGIDYAPVSEQPQRPSGTRAVIVVDRGWIYAGDVTRKDGRITLDRAVWVMRWESIGFDGLIADPKSKKATIKPMPYPVEIPEGAEIFAVPVPDTWGL